MKPTTLFSIRTYQIALLLLLGTLSLTCYRRTGHFDDAWFAEQSYWLVHDGWVRSELFRGYNGWEDRIYVFHKLFIYAGALVMRVAGFSLAASKLLTIVCGTVTGWLIWRYGRHVSREQRWLAVLLYFGCGTIIRYFAVNRPEIMCMMLGFASYLALNPSSGAPPRPFSAGFLAGLAMLTHLNGLIYLMAGGIWLLTFTDWRRVAQFAGVGMLTASLYMLDALLDGNFAQLFRQFLDDPATQSNFRLSDKLWVMLNYHQLFLHSHREVPLSMLALLCLLAFRGSLSHRDALLVYLGALFFTFLLLSKSNFDFYYILFVPWLALLVAASATTFLPTPPLGQRRLTRGLLIGYFGVSLFTVGQVLVENYTEPYDETYNARLADHMPHKHTKVIAPISFFFGQMKNYQVRGLAYYYLLQKRGEELSLADFFAQAAKEKVEYIVSDRLGNASYPIPQDAPDRIGNYQRIFQDKVTSIYARMYEHR